MIYDPTLVLKSNTIANTSNDREWKNFSTNLNFRHTFDSTGQEITADVDYLTYRSTNQQVFDKCILRPQWSSYP
jgi:hypothetical protein